MMRRFTSASFSYTKSFSLGPTEFEQFCVSLLGSLDTSSCRSLIAVPIAVSTAAASFVKES